MSIELEQSIFNSLHDPFAIRRKYMLPGWIRVFCWIFAFVGFAGGLIGIIRIFYDFGSRFSILGFTTYEGNSLFWSILTIGTFLFKGVAATGLLNEKDWAVKCAIADGIVGIAISVFSMIFDPWATHADTGIWTTTHYNFRIELLFLIPYLTKMIRIRRDWDDTIFLKQQISAFGI